MHKTFKEACYTLGLLDDDQEYIDGLKQEFRGSGDYLRKPFATLLLSNNMSKPEFVWLST